MQEEEKNSDLTKRKTIRGDEEDGEKDERKRKTIVNLEKNDDYLEKMMEIRGRKRKALRVVIWERK